MRKSLGLLLITATLLAPGACSSGDTNPGTECTAIGADCFDDPEACCPGTLCTVNGLGQNTCSQLCTTNADCDSRCCHGLANATELVCDIANACGTGGSGGAGTSGAGGSGGSLPGTGGSAGGGGGGITCDDNVHEPNDTDDLAISLEDTNDCNDSLIAVSEEVLAPDDVDWFAFNGTDDICDMEASVNVSAGAESLRLCVFAEIESGCDVVCDTGTAESSPTLPGCCSWGTDPSIAWSTTCGLGESASALVVIRVDNPLAVGEQCAPYDLAYRF